MATTEATISIKKSLYDMLGAISHDLELPDTNILELAVEEFVERYQNNKELLQKINAAHDDLPDQEEKTLLIKMKSGHKRLVAGQW